jgi:hypothetical protein
MIGLDANPNAFAEANLRKFMLNLLPPRPSAVLHNCTEDLGLAHGVPHVLPTDLAVT